MIYDIKLTSDGRIPRISAIDLVSDIHGHYHGVAEGTSYYNLWMIDNTLLYRIEVDMKVTRVLHWSSLGLMSPSYLVYEAYKDVRQLSKIEYGESGDMLCMADYRLNLVRCKYGPCERCETFADCIQSGYKERYLYIPKE